MGKGDKKTRRGKIIMKSTGVTRPRKKKRANVAVVEESKKTAKKLVDEPIVDIEKSAEVKEKPEPKTKAVAKKPTTKKPATKKKSTE